MISKLTLILLSLTTYPERNFYKKALTNQITNDNTDISNNAKDISTDNKKTSNDNKNCLLNYPEQNAKAKINFLKT